MKFIVLYLTYYIVWVLLMYMYCIVNNYTTLRVRCKFVKEDCWIGVYYSFINIITFSKTSQKVGFDSIKYYFCIIPCFPIVFIWETEYKNI